MDEILNTLWIVMMIITSVQVFLESQRTRRVGHPWAHAFMCFIVVWPFAYLLWLFWWPGKLRQAIFGSDKDRAKRWAEKMLKKNSEPAPGN